MDIKQAIFKTMVSITEKCIRKECTGASIAVLMSSYNTLRTLCLLLGDDYSDVESAITATYAIAKCALNQEGIEI